MIRYLPLGGFVILLALLLFGLGNDPRNIPSPLVGKPVPEFSLPRLYEPTENVSPDVMKGKVWLLNVWASWCVSCRAEHAVVSQLAKDTQLNIVGLNYKDTSPDAKEWLRQFSNPYSMIAVDLDGRVGIDWGVYGVPESYLIDKKGIIRHKFTGPIDQKIVVDTLKPLLEKLRAEAV